MSTDAAHLDPLLGPFVARAASEPERPAIFAADGREVSHASLLASAERVAECIFAKPCADEHDDTVIALSAPPGLAFVRALLAARLARRRIALLDHGGPTETRRRIAAEIGASGLWCPDEGGVTPIEGARVARAGALGRADFIKLTSGSTGSPRGVLVTSDALAADGAQLVRAIGLTSDDRSLAVLPLSHSYGLSVLVLPLLLAGVPIVFPGKFAPLAVAREAGATFMPSVPAWFSALVAHTEPDDWRGPLRLLMTAGAPLTPELARTIRGHTGLGVHVLYGASEVGGIAYDRTGRAAERGSVGEPVEGVTVDLEGPDAEGVGRVLVRTPAAALGSWPPCADDPLARDTFRAADRAAWRDGELVLRGRTDRIVNVRGKKVDPAHVERALMAVADVREAAALGVELPGDRGTVVRAVVALAPGSTTRAADLLRTVRAELAPHEMPRGVVFVPTLPRTVRGKLDRAALVGLAAGEAGAP